MAPAPAPAPATGPADSPPVVVGDEGAKDQNKMVLSKSEDVSMGGVQDDGDLPVPCSEPAGGAEMAPEPVEDKGGDTTECSSSFGDTCSGFGDDADGGEPEVSSQALVPIDDDRASQHPRRKKVTAEWRNAIRPIMWRCHWLELRMKDLLSQVSKYDRELALIEKEKRTQQEVSKSNGSMPDAMLIYKDHRNSSMERRKRKRHEDIADTSLYIKKHPILSQYNDKQNKGAETDGLLLDDDGSHPGGFDTSGLVDAEDYDLIFEQVSLKDILSTIDGVQSQVNLLKDRLNKAHLEEDNLAFSEDNTHARVPRKRQSTQKFCDTSYMTYQNTKPQKYRNAKPQKRKNLNILLKDDDGPALDVKPGIPNRGTNYPIEDAKGNSEGKSREWNRSQDRAITMDLLLGVDNSLQNVHMGDLCNENADDILIDNQTANEGCPQFEKIEHLPSETSSRVENASAPMEVKKTSAPMAVDGISSALKVDSTSATVVNQESLLEKSPMLKPVKKRGWKPRERKNVWGSASSSMNHSKGASAASDSELKSNGAPPSAKEEIESTTPTAPMDPEIMTPLAAWKKRKAGNKSASAEEYKAGNLASKNQNTGTSAGNKYAAAEEHKAGNVASKKQNTGKKRKSENSSSPAAKKQKTESTPSKRGTQSPSKLMVEKAVLVAVNSRRSQRVRKPKVY
ncbi:hypothetical protein QOZ80_1BG0063840 [Eleusine coracana subsp. coracana]|nr:hypothetical protein QOZ80_1BG0063840 [Eleusine coracana subsp. coracana]